MPSHIVSQAQIDTICSRLGQKEDCCSDTAGIHERQSHEPDIRPGERIQHQEDYDGRSAAPVRRNVQTTYTSTTARPMKAGTVITIKMNNRTFLIEKGETMSVCLTVSFHIVKRACGRFLPYQGFIDFTPVGGNCRVKKTLPGCKEPSRPSSPTIRMSV